jgi:Fatty acid hydroxylase superfamily
MTAEAVYLAKKNWFPISCFVIIAACLSGGRHALGIATAIAMALASYWLHRATHVGVFKNVPMGHARVHHDPDHWLRKLPQGSLLAQVHEAVTNLMCAGGFMLLCPPLLRAVPMVVPLWTALFYTTLHFVNFHSNGPAGELHRAHHADPTKNFGPSVFDAAFGTYTGPEDMTNWVPTMVATAIAAAAIAKLMARSRAGRE